MITRILTIKNKLNTKLVKNTLIYTGFQFVNKGIPFLLLPIITHYLTKEDYGKISIFNTYLQFLFLFVGLSVNSAISVNFFHLNKKEFKQYFGNVFYILFSMFIIVLFFVLVFANYISEKTSLPVEWIFIGVIVALMSVVVQLTLSLWRLRQEAKQYAFFETSMILVNVIISLILIILYQMHWIGRVLGIVIAAILFGIISLYILNKKRFLDFKFNKNYIKDALKLGISLLPHYFAQWLRSGIDIFFITYLIGIKATGIYALGYQLGAIIGILVGAFNMAFAPYQMEILKNNDIEQKKKLVKFTYIFFIAIFIFALFFGEIMKFIFPYFIDEKFIEATQFITIIAVAYSFQGMYYMVVNYLFFTKKNSLVSLATIFSTGFQVLVAYILIKKIGAYGAAIAVVISFFLNFIIIWFMSIKVYPMPWLLIFYKGKK